MKFSDLNHFFSGGGEGKILRNFCFGPKYFSKYYTLQGSLLILACITLIVRAPIVLGVESIASIELHADSESCGEDQTYSASVNWNVEDIYEKRSFEVRVSSMDGRLFAKGGRSGSSRTGPWVKDGMMFLLVDPDSSRVLAQTSAERKSCPLSRSSNVNNNSQADLEVKFELSPQRIIACGRPPTAISLDVIWEIDSTYDTPVEVRLDAVNGKTFARGSSVGRKRTGEWVTDGKKFFLINMENGNVLAVTSFEVLPCDSQERARMNRLRI